MTNALILNQSVALAIELEDADEHRDIVETRFLEMAQTINAATDRLSPVQADVFRLTRTLTIFRKKVFRGLTMTRSFMDQPGRNFHWTIDEFLQWDPAPRRPTAYFHDAWHIQQFLTLGPPPNDEEILIDREQDAMGQQLEIARLLDCDETMVAWLTDYAHDREKIRSRVLSGIGFGEIRPHFTVFA